MKFNTIFAFVLLTIAQSSLAAVVVNGTVSSIEVRGRAPTQLYLSRNGWAVGPLPAIHPRQVVAAAAAAVPGHAIGRVARLELRTEETATRTSAPFSLAAALPRGSGIVSDGASTALHPFVISNSVVVYRFKDHRLLYRWTIHI
ncbi:unnamed protein product [Cyclocybe aegerita]|uniref:Uncharacterized protein n=1 Tax=Cyclocybe aegerita TaxID=1973307 RepID=A0A8S0WZV3_CYCAE|nr:unnamed protein product [Cyclocybe aegerita]